ncbi:MAG: nucleoside deaminase [Planctomycetota bacterium]|jgi:tRNA(adenine34) deaminase
MSPTSKQDQAAMQRCIELARSAGERGEVPVGAVVCVDGEVIAEAANACEEQGSPLEHAEMIALRAAFRSTKDARLPGAVLYCSLEPCFMCTGAILHSRIQRIVFATRDPKFGACASLAQLPADRRLNHRCEVSEGLMAEESAALLREFFRRLR